MKIFILTLQKVIKNTFQSTWYFSTEIFKWSSVCDVDNLEKINVREIPNAKRAVIFIFEYPPKHVFALKEREKVFYALVLKAVKRLTKH